MSFPNNYSCSFCGTKFKTTNSLTVHIKTAQYCIDSRASFTSPEISKPHVCQFCDKSFAQKQTYNRHLKTCERLKNIMVNDIAILKDKLQESDNKLRKTERKFSKLQMSFNELDEKYKTLEEKYNETITKEIPLLKADVAFSKGQVEGLKTAPPTKVVNSTKSNNGNYYKNIAITTIKPFTVENLQSELLPQYTYDIFKQKLTGIADLVLSFTSQEVNGVLERNLISTDKKRDVFHSLKETREWEKDDGISVCKRIVNVFHDKVEDYYYKLLKEDTEMRSNLKMLKGPSVKQTDEYKKYKIITDAHWDLVQDIRSVIFDPIHNGKLRDTDNEYLELVKKIRDLIQPHIHFVK